jgi:flagellar hook-length control protein FliK
LLSLPFSTCARSGAPLASLLVDHCLFDRSEFLVAGSTITGFSPAAPLRGAVLGSGGEPDAAKSSGFDALLGAVLPKDAVLPKGVEKLADAVVAALGKTDEVLADGMVDAETGQPAAELVVPATVDELPDAAAPSLEDLVEMLAALETALQSGQPVDPALHEQIKAALDALAAFLDLPQPAPTPPPTAAAGLDPLLALPNTGSPAAAPAGSVPAPSTLPAADGTDAPQPLLGRLAEKLEALATGLQTTAPDLAAKLQAVAAQLTSGTIDPQKLAALGLDPDAALSPDLRRALETLLATTAPVKPAVPPPAFTAATLALPPDVVPAPKQQQALAPEAAPRRAAAETRNEPEIKPAAANRAPERTDAAEPRTPARNSFAPAMAAAEQAGAETKPTAAIEPAATTAIALVAGAKAIHAAYQAPVQQPNMPQIAFEMVRQFQAGNSRFQIRLDPPELGRIDVRMDVDRDGNVMARMTVERSETLDLMQRDQRALEKALAQAGLDGSKTNLEFSLRQQSSGNGQRDGSEPSLFADGSALEADDAGPASGITQYRGSASPGGVNLFV